MLEVESMSVDLVVLACAGLFYRRACMTMDYIKLHSVNFSLLVVIADHGQLGYQIEEAVRRGKYDEL
jgi:hypothetical protein